MLNIFKLNLLLHDDGASVSAEGGTGEGADIGAEVNGTVDAGQQTEGVTSEDLGREFDELTRGKYKDQFKQATQKIIDRRFAKSKEMENQIKEQKTILDILHQRYGTRSNQALLESLENDESYFEMIAEKEGITREQAQLFDRMRRENEQFKAWQEEAQEKAKRDAQINKWITEANALQAKYPDFDFEAELANEDFAALLQAGIPVEHAYKTLHYEELAQMNTEYTARQTEKKVVQNIPARGTRPQEVCASNKAAFTSSQSIENLTGEQIREILRTKSTGDKLF